MYANYANDTITISLQISYNNSACIALTIIVTIKNTVTVLVTKKCMQTTLMIQLQLAYRSVTITVPV